MLSYICLLALVPFAFAIKCENKQVAVSGGYEVVVANGGETCNDPKWCVKMTVTTADSLAVVTQCAGDTHTATCENFATDKCWEAAEGTKICCCSDAGMCNKTPYVLGTRKEGSGSVGEAEGNGASMVSAQSVVMAITAVIVANVVA